MRRVGNLVLGFALAGMVLALSRVGSTFVVFAASGPEVSPTGLIVGLAVLVGGGVMVGQLLPPQWLRPRAVLVAGLVCLAVAALSVGALLGLPWLGGLRERGPMAVIMSPLGLGLAVTLGSSLLWRALALAGPSRRRSAREAVD